jgi:hypothetical protein
MRTSLALPVAVFVSSVMLGGLVQAQQKSAMPPAKPASQKEQAELAQPPGTPSPKQVNSAKDAELRYGPSLYDKPEQTQQDATKADETDQTPRTHEVEDKADAGKASRPPQDQEQEGTKPPRRKPAGQRRSARQDVLTMPPAPVLRAAAPIRTPPPASVVPDPAGPMPVQCDASGCIGPGGQRMNGGIGTALIAPGGKLCVRSGATVQCN